MLSDFASLANGPWKQYPLRRQTLTQGFLEHGIEVTTSGHLNPYSLGASAAAPPHMRKEQGQPERFLLF